MDLASLAAEEDAEVAALLEVRSLLHQQLHLLPAWVASHMALPA